MRHPTRQRLHHQRVGARVSGYRGARHLRDQEGDRDRGLEDRNGQAEGRARPGQQVRVQPAGQRENVEGEVGQ